MLCLCWVSPCFRDTQDKEESGRGRNGETWLGKDRVKLWKGQVQKEVGRLSLKCPGTGH